MKTFPEKKAQFITNFVEKMYVGLLTPVIVKLYKPQASSTGAHRIHDKMIHLSAIADNSALAQAIINTFYESVYLPQQGEYKVGGLILPSDLILAAGWVKGLGFESEDAAVAAVRSGVNIIPGYASVSKLTGGLAEFGSYTRFPRLGNKQPAIWRLPGGFPQNRVGLTNPGAVAAAEFLSQIQIRNKLPQFFGINIAVSPGLDDEVEQLQHVSEAFTAFLERRVYPAWFTLNISCPNTEDDPEGIQTEVTVRQLCQVALHSIQKSTQDIPLWVKISPNLGAERYKQLMSIFADLGVKAVIATNTRPEPAPHDSALMAGVSGRTLHQDAVTAVQLLQAAKHEQGIDSVDVIACGGVEDGVSYLDFGEEVAARQFLTAVIFRGPTAAALIRQEAEALSDT